MGLKTTLTRGLEFEQRWTSVRNGSGADRVKGDVMMFDDNLTSALATNLKEADDNSGLVVVIQTLATRDEDAWYCVLAEDIEDGNFGKAWLEHPGVRVRTTGASSPGDRMSVTVNGFGLGTLIAAAGRHLALCKGTAGGADEFPEMLFMGVPAGDLGNE